MVFQSSRSSRLFRKAGLMILECRECHHLAENTELRRRPSGVSQCLRCGGIRFLIRPFLRLGPDRRIIVWPEDLGERGKI